VTNTLIVHILPVYRWNAEKGYSAAGQAGIEQIGGKRGAKE
jgi:hypothetical protein